MTMVKNQLLQRENQILLEKIRQLDILVKTKDLKINTLKLNIKQLIHNQKLFKKVYEGG
jgi:hypothetical protein